MLLFSQFFLCGSALWLTAKSLSRLDFPCVTLSRVDNLVSLWQMDLVTASDPVYGRSDRLKTLGDCFSNVSSSCGGVYQTGVLVIDHIVPTYRSVQTSES